MSETFQTVQPVCPHCGHEYDTDDMHAAEDAAGDPISVWDAPPNERDFDLRCPSCAEVFYVKSGYKPWYTTATEEDAL